MGRQAQDLEGPEHVGGLVGLVGLYVVDVCAGVENDVDLVGEGGVALGRESKITLTEVTGQGTDACRQLGHPAPMTDMVWIGLQIGEGEERQ